MTVLVAALLLPIGARASAPPQTAASVSAPRSPAPFRGPHAPAGVLRIWGPEAMSPVVRLWARDFQRLHPDIRVQAQLMGSDTAIPGLYSGLAQIALMGRRNDGTDDNGFSRPKGYRFERLRVMAGSLAAQGQSPALAILVSAGNPLSRMTVAQLAAIARCGCSQPPRHISTWGQLGAPGSWAHRPVHLYIVDSQSGTGRYFVRAVLGDSRALDWPRVTEFHDRRRADGTFAPAAAQTAAALRRDPYGIAVSTLQYQGRGLKVVAMAKGPSGPFVLPDRASIASGAYPLARSAYAFIDRRPGQALAPDVKAFLDYILGAHGQVDIARADAYLPLAPGIAAQERSGLCGGDRQCK